MSLKSATRSGGPLKPGKVQRGRREPTPPTKVSGGVAGAVRRVHDVVADPQLRRGICALSAAAADDPPLILDWNTENVQRFVAAVAQGPPGLPQAPFPLPRGRAASAAAHL